MTINGNDNGSFIPIVCPSVCLRAHSSFVLSPSLFIIASNQWFDECEKEWEANGEDLSLYFFIFRHKLHNASNETILIKNIEMRL